MVLVSVGEKLVARHSGPADGFRECQPGGISLGLYLREAEVQKLMRKCKCNIRGDVDWRAFCNDIEKSKTLTGGY
jgi:Ca2+-binding EF-hand superfamily protein